MLRVQFPLGTDLPLLGNVSSTTFHSLNGLTDPGSCCGDRSWICGLEAQCWRGCFPQRPRVPRHWSRRRGHSLTLPAHYSLTSLLDQVGRKAALLFARAGCSLVLWDLSAKGLEETAKEIAAATGVKCLTQVTGSLRAPLTPRCVAG